MKTKHIRNFVGILAFLFMAISCAEEVVLVFDASLKITVLDVDNKPVEGATIRIIPVIDGVAKSDISNEEYSDSKGEFLLKIHDENLDTRYHREKPVVLSDREKYIQSDHTYQIKTTKTGYLDAVETVVLKNGDSNPLTLRLLKK